MIAVNSNCSRVDAVKAAATLLKLQSSAAAPSASASSAQGSDARKVNSDLQTLDGVVKTGDAQKAELALAATKKDVEAAETAPAQKFPGQNSRTLDAYA